MSKIIKLKVEEVKDKELYKEYWEKQKAKEEQGYRQREEENYQEYIDYLEKCQEYEDKEKELQRQLE